MVKAHYPNGCVCLTNKSLRFWRTHGSDAQILELLKNGNPLSFRKRMINEVRVELPVKGAGKHISCASSASSGTDCLELAPYSSGKFLVQNPMVSSKASSGNASKPHRVLKTSLTISTSSRKNSERGYGLKTHFIVWFPTAWVFFAGTAHVCVALSWPASCPSYDLAQDDESQGANTVIMFGYYAGVAVLVSVLTRGIFMHRSSHVLHFHAKMNAMFASCVLLFFSCAA